MVEITCTIVGADDKANLWLVFHADIRVPVNLMTENTFFTVNNANFHIDPIFL